MRSVFTALYFILVFLQSSAGIVTGVVSDSSGRPIPFAGISVKGQRISTGANQNGVYTLQLDPGNYTIICRHVGYARQERNITVTAGEQRLNFILLPQEVVMEEIVVKAGGEDPAYAIIRKAIRKREEHLRDLRTYQCEVYSKGVMNLRDFPSSFMGSKVDFEDGDTSKKKMIYLSESVSRLSVGGVDKRKTEVISTRVSGQKDGFGFAGSSFYSFYENNIRISNALNPRGFISPVSDQALQYYRYKWEGMFLEDGKWINQIKVTPKRTYEPCFSGHIQIVENEWAIHSLQLKLLKENQMAFADTLVIEQLCQPMGSDLWLMQSQVLYPAVLFMGFDAYGSFVNVYRNFQLNPKFPKGFWDQTVLKYEQGSNQKERRYWDSIRPVLLADAEREDYFRKDSLEQLRKNPDYLDSIDRKRNKIRITELLLTGKTFSRQKERASFTIPSMIQAIGFNPAEGWLADLPMAYSKSYTDRKRISIRPHLRYGFSSKRWFGWGSIRYTTGHKYRTVVGLSGGSRVFQFNQDNPIEPLQNTVSSLFYKNNFMKTYAAEYLRITLNKNLPKGIGLLLSGSYENRSPMENKTDFNWNPLRKRPYFPNYPTELGSQNFNRHQAAIVSAEIRFQPGARYIELPDRIINIGSKWPLFTAGYVQGIQNLLGSDVDYRKWKLEIKDDLNFKLAGRLFYQFQGGGFLSASRVEWQDLNHFPGNRLLRASDYMTTFQLPLYYRFSNRDRLYGLLFAEYHLNGFLTNKIPLIKKLNWHLVGGAGSLWRSGQFNYWEWHLGLDNIFRTFRVDLVRGYYGGNSEKMEIRIGSRINITNSDD